MKALNVSHLKESYKTIMTRKSNNNDRLEQEIMT